MNETLSKQEYQYLKNIEKLEQLVEKQELKIKEKTDNETVQLAKVDTLQKEVKSKDIEKGKQAEMIAELEQINNGNIITEQNLQNQIKKVQSESLGKDNLIREKDTKIAELQSTALDEKELLFYYACKADLILYGFYEQDKLKLTLEELKAKNFPIAMLEKGMKEPIKTSNYVLTYTNKSFQLNEK